MVVTADPPGISVQDLDHFLRENLPGLLTGPLQVRLLSGGRSNLTYLLTDGHSQWVLRRPPLGHVLATAHDMSREFRVLQALHPTQVPVPKPFISAGPDVIGAPFYIMEFTDGAVLRDRQDLEAFGPQATTLAGNLIDVLAELHAVDAASVGLADLGRPEGYLERQLRRWERQLAASHSRELPDLARLGQRLGERLPTGQDTVIVHGDYRLDNVVIDSSGTSVRSVLDWEMATLGDPLADLASTVIWWDGISGLDSPVAAVPGDVPGFPASDVLTADYARSTGRDLSDLPWYLGFAFYKIAAIFEGIHYRTRQGLTVGDGFEQLGAMVPALVERGHAALAS